MSGENIRSKKKLTGSILAKIAAYFLLAISFLTAGVATVITISLAEQDVYSYGDSTLGMEKVAEGMMSMAAYNDIRDLYYQVWPEDEYRLQGMVQEYCKGKNIRMDIYKIYPQRDGLQREVASTYDGFDTPYFYSSSFMEYEETGKETLEVIYEIRAYVDPELPVNDEYVVSYERAISVWNQKYAYPIVAVSGILLFIMSFLFLMCAAGHKNGESSIVPGVLTPIPFDLLSVGFGMIAIFLLIAGVEMTRGYDNILVLMLLAVVGTIEVVWCTIYCVEAALRFKLGKWWKNSIIYVIFHYLRRAIRFVWNGYKVLMKGLPAIATTVIICGGICFLELMLLSIWGIDDFVFLWIMEKLILLPVVFYIALVCKKLQEGSRALAEGNLNYKLDTSKMVLDFKEHGENLNQIGRGISKAVEERMKSERMKTELITNVSHDIKTPLTSIINYADLLGNAVSQEEHLEREKVAEYSEVLLRQSGRLKKLLEDLVEASKATTGNIEVKMEKCEVGVLLSQAVGEYEQRFAEKQLEIITRQAEEPVWIMADGRRLWRVFDNLLNNVCKYAQENSRVYLSVEPGAGKVEIIFRNMSKYALNLTGEELEERFVRGDKSRHMEGNGLGLSIAKSLVELQNGTMKITTDGDLFKVTLTFDIVDAKL